MIFEHPSICLSIRFYELRIGIREHEYIINQLLYAYEISNRLKGVLGQYIPDLNIIGLFDYSLKQSAKNNKIPIERQVARVLSHEVFHALLFQEHGANACHGLDSEFKHAETLSHYLKEYGLR